MFPVHDFSHPVQQFCCYIADERLRQKEVACLKPLQGVHSGNEI